MSVYLKATLIAAGLVAAATVSAQPMLTARAADCPADTHKSRHEHPSRRPALKA